MGTLTVLGEVAHSNTIDGKPIVLNRMQCNNLAHTCISTLRQMNESSLPDRLRTELHETVFEILAYFESCTQALWLSALATHLDPQEAYLLHLKDFIVCVATWLALDGHRHNAQPFVDCFIQSVSDCEYGMSPSKLKDHVWADQQEMLVLLRSTQKKHNVLEETVDQVSTNCCFPFHLKKKKFSGPPQSYQLAAFLARKCGETVNLSASPKSVPQAFYIDSKELHALKRTLIGEEEGFSKVYETTWLGQTVVVKEFDTQDETFIKEASMLAGLSNPYVIKLIGWSRNQAKGTYSLIMERMDEGLHDYMSRSSPSLEVAVDIMLQISRGMEYLHGMKVMHRDLKPPNVLVSSCRRKACYLRVKLSDFGVAKYQPETPFFSTERQGTWYYRAPEVLQYTESTEGEGVNVVFKKYTLKADIFSFAILCYEILAERAPDCFLCHPKEFYNRVTSNMRPELPGSCPPLLADCIKRCWHSEPSYRPSFTEVSKVLVYMKSALIVLDSPTIANESAIFSKFVEEANEQAKYDGPPS